MATALPAALKAADLHRFAARAAQLQNFRPVVTYWLEYYVLQALLAKQLHSNDEECSNYAITLMDKLEAFKQENAANDAVVDDVAAKAYVENFALETFARGDDAQRGNKVSRQTADTFQAAATFIDVLAIWGPVEEDLKAKSKYAKFHALRIAKALKAGEDPNATNPVVEPPAQEDAQMEDADVDAELKELERETSGAGASGTAYQPPTVESAPDSRMPSRPGSTAQGGPFAPPILPTQPPEETPDIPSVPASGPMEDEYRVSPVDSPAGTNRQPSVGGGYFPSVPDAEEASAPPPMNIDTASQPPSAPQPLQTPFTPSDFYPKPGDPQSSPPAPQVQPFPGNPPFAGGNPSINTKLASRRLMDTGPHTPAAAIINTPTTIPPPPQYGGGGPNAGAFNTDDESVVAAQKHAKWAISALNFEDVNTAVKELRFALRALGAN